MGDGEIEAGVVGDPLVTVVICTRNRAQDLPMAVESVLRSDHPSFELIVIDQSTEPASADYLAGVDDPRLRVVPTDTAGLSVARNLGTEAAATETVLMTDDDCVVSATWISEMSQVLDADPQVAAVFGVVDAAPCDDAVGFVPAGPILRNRTFESAWRYDPRFGIGASVGFRRSPVIAAGGFDPRLGAGGEFKSAEEVDMALRLLLSGQRVAHSTSARVVHHGFRTFDEARTLVRGYMLGTAAAHVKLVRCGHTSVIGSFVRAVWGSLVPPTISALRRFRLPPILGRVTSLGLGLWRGLRAPVDRHRLVFRSPTGESNASPG